MFVFALEVSFIVTYDTNYQTRALSDTDESKNTYSDKTDRPRFVYPGPSSQHCQQYLWKWCRVPAHHCCSNTTKTKDPSSPPARQPCSALPAHGASTSCIAWAACGLLPLPKRWCWSCWSVFARAPPPLRPSGEFRWAGRFVALVLLSD